MPTSGCGPARTGGRRSRTSPSSASSTSASASRSACCSRSCSTRRSAPRACCARSTSTRWRSRFIVTGTAWKWILNPGLGIEKTDARPGASPSFKFDWLVNPDMAIYTVVIAGVWQASGFVMAMFLAACAASTARSSRRRRSTAPAARSIYRRIVIPLLRPVFLSAFVVLAHLAIKSYDLVDRADRRRARARHRAARDLHVLDTPSPATRWRWRGERRDHADDGRRDHRALPLFRAAGEKSRHELSRRRRRPAAPAPLDRAGRASTALLLLFALFYLLPLYVMVVDLAQERSTRSATATCWRCRSDPSLAAWAKAWGSGLRRRRLHAASSRYFLNSVAMVVPAVAISTLLGALNGYVLTKWRFRGAQRRSSR